MINILIRLRALVEHKEQKQRVFIRAEGLLSVRTAPGKGNCKLRGPEAPIPNWMMGWASFLGILRGLGPYHMNREFIFIEIFCKSKGFVDFIGLGFDYIARM